MGLPRREQMEEKMAMKEYKTNKTTEELLAEMKAGKPVKALDFMASMGIKTIVVE